MNEKPNVSAPFLGMNLVDDPSAFEPGEFSFLLNAGISGIETGSPFITNINGTDRVLAFPEGFVPIGKGKISNDENVVFLLEEATGLCQIGIVSKAGYEVKAKGAFNFKIDSPIQAVCKKIYNGHRIVYWVDHNPMRRIDLDNVPYIKSIDAGGNVIVTDEVDLDQIKIFKDYNNPDFRINTIENVGMLKSGGYYITTQYSDARGNGLTACARLSNKIPIIEDSPDSAIESITGYPSGKQTNKAINITLQNVDLSFSFLNIIAVTVVDAGFRAFKIATISTTQSEYLYTGAEVALPLNLDDVVALQAVYDRAETISDNDGSLLLGNLLAPKKLNLQPYVNKIQIQWVAYKAKADNRQKTYKNPLFASYYQCYRRDEIVPLGLVFELTDGTVTDCYPMVAREINKKANGSVFTETADQYGRPVNSLAWDTHLFDINADNYEKENLPRYKIYNTATVEGNLLPSTDTEGLSFYGETAYCEIGGRYPNNKDVWGDLAGQPIRFPKMPDSSIIHVHDGQQLTRSSEEYPYLYYLGFRFPNIEEVLLQLPDSIKKKIKTWRVVRADRSKFKTVLASGVLFNCLEQQFKIRNSDTDDFRLVPNYPLNDLRPDPYLKEITSVLENDSNEYNRRYSKKHFTFYSPDTTLQKAILTDGEIKIESELYGTSTCYFGRPNYPTFTREGDKKEQAALTSYAVAKYNCFNKINAGNVRRLVEEVLYVPANSQISGGNSGRRIWNKMRESSVFVSLTENIEDPTVKDKSRIIINGDEPEITDAEKFNCGDDVLARRNRPVSLYYVTLKKRLKNLYSDFSKIAFIDTGITEAIYKEVGACFGGDTYICGYAFKRQMAFYDDVQRWMSAPNGGDGINFQATVSVPGVRHYYKNVGSNPRRASVMTCEDNKGNFLGLGDGDGKSIGFLNLCAFGIPFFWVESDINADLRLEGTVAAEAVYPSLLNGAINLEDWAGIPTVHEDNYFEYNSDLTGKEALNLYYPLPVDYDPNNQDEIVYDTRVIKSLRSQSEDIYDNWQVFKPLDYYDFEKNRGPLKDIRYIGSGTSLFRFKEGMFQARVIDQLTVAEGTVTLGAGRLFDQKPEEVSFTDNGIMGTDSKFAFDTTPYGTFMLNAATGQVFRMGGKTEELSEKKAYEWFRTNLPFKLSAQIPGIKTDTAYNPKGIGIVTMYDPQNRLWLITKKDYEIRTPELASQITHSNGYFYLNGQPVELTNEDVFINRSFTIGYSPIRDRWFSFYSFIPNMYLFLDNNMYSIDDTLGVSYMHLHNTNKTTIYGIKRPFIVEMISKAQGESFTSMSQTFETKAFLLKPWGALVPVQNKTFNKAIIFSDSGCSGVLELIVPDETKLSELYKFPKTLPDRNQIQLRYRSGKWSFSDYWNIATDYDFFTNDWDEPSFRKEYFIDKVLKPANINYNKVYSSKGSISGKFVKVRLIYDAAEDLKLLVQANLEITRSTIN